ncbi:MAG: carboxypeptidase regulatory-like domain-containing protein [Chloracidobacterium sp.]|nr:carboxypeptidase regulatory-like domain-containing protein [Chloracidobacterium sp.]
MKLGVKRFAATFLKVFASLLIGVMVSLSLAASVGAATFPANAPTLGAIPDGTGVTTCGADGTAKDVTFTVSGISSAPSLVEVSMTLAPAHTWRGDLTARLIAPNGTSFILYRYIGSTTLNGCGSGLTFGGPFNFKDSAAGANIWTTNSPGDYRTTAAGGAGQVNPAPVTNLTAAFAGIPTSNGDWILRMTDGGVGDTGSVSAATLTLTGPTAAGVGISGRVLTSADGRGLVGARVTLTDQNGSTRNVMTGKGGRYIFDDLEPGQTYIVNVMSRRFNFQPQVIQVTDNIAELNFVPE